MTVSASNPSNLKQLMSTGGKSFHFSTDSRHKKFNNSSYSSLSKAPFMKLQEVCPPIGKGNQTQTINDEDQSEWSNCSPPLRNKPLNFSRDESEQSHLEIVSILATDILSYCSGAVGREDSFLLSKRNINSLHISSLRGNGDYCSIAANRLDFDLLKLSTFFNPDSLSRQSAYLGRRAFATIRQALPNNFQDYDYPDTLLIRFRNKDVMNQIFSQELYPQNIIQGKFRTCAFAAALVSLVNHDCLFDTFYLTSLIKKINGIDYVTFFFNGQQQRYVPVLRKLLVSEQDVFLNTHSEDLQVIGFSMIEKAMQMLYSSPDGSIHSNMAVQLYHLTGWIPEVVAIKDITNHQFLWEMLSSNFREGNIMLGFGIKDMPLEEQTPANKQSVKSRVSGLVLNHAYTVLIFTEDGDKKCIQFKNPWGKYPANREICSQESMNKSRIEEEDQGIFTLTWENVLQYFQCISLVWNPTIYPNQLKTHETWKNPYAGGRTIFTDHIYCLLHFPQYLVRIKPQKQNSEIRLLLERHQTKSLSQKKGIGVKLMQFEHNRVAYTHQVIRSTKNAQETVNSDVFVFEASRENQEYVFVVFFDNPEPVINYTLTIFSFTEVEVAQIPPVQMKKSRNLQGQWRENLELGPIRSCTFLNSAQFKLTVDRRSALRFSAECDQDLKIQIMIVSSDMPLERTPLGRIESALSPGFYYSRFSCCEALLDEGEYIIVLACKNEIVEALTNYQLCVDQFANSNGSWEIVKREEESKITLKKEVQGRWDKENSMGSFKNLNSTKYQAQVQLDLRIYNNPAYILDFQNRTSFQFYLQPLPRVASSTSTNKLIFRKSAIPACGILVCKIIVPGQEYEIVYSSEIEEQKAFGFKTIPILLDPNEEGYIVVCTTSKKGYQGDFKFYVEATDEFNIQRYSLFQQCKNTKRIINKFPYHGGKFRTPSYYLNSQYCLKALGSGKLIVQIYTLKSMEIALHVFKSKGLPLSKLKEETLNAVDGTQYQENCVSHVLQITEGISYSLVPSSGLKEKDKAEVIFKLYQSYYFVLTIGSLSVPFEVKQISQKHYEPCADYDLLFELENGRAKKEFRLSVDEICHFKAHAFTQEQNAVLSIKLWEITDEGFTVKIQQTQNSLSMGVILQQQLYPNKNGYVLAACLLKKECNHKVHVRLQLVQTPADSIQVLIL